MRTKTENYIVNTLIQNTKLVNIPIYRNGVLNEITGISDTELYENRQIAYDAIVFVSDEIVYNLDDVNSILDIEIPKFTNDIQYTFDLSYILKMKANAEKREDFVIPLVTKAIDLMNASPLKWAKKDYRMLVIRLLKCGKINEGILLDKEIENQFTMFEYNIHPKFSQYDTDLFVATTHYGTCAECSMLQGRVYSLSGNDKRFPKLPEYAKKNGKFHKGCRHNFFPFYDGICELIVHSNDGKVLVKKDPIQYSNRKYVDSRTNDEKQIYRNYIDKIENDEIFYKLQKEYYTTIKKDNTSISFNAFLKSKKFKRIV